MQKLIYPVWRGPDHPGDNFRDELLLGLAPHLVEVKQLSTLRIGVVDSDVELAADKRIETCQALPDGLISLWIESDECRRAIETAIAARVGCYAGYCASEVEAIANTRHPARSGERVYGFCQIAFLRRPARLEHSEWLSIWQESHTAIAIDTQSTFAYRQNLITKSLCDGAVTFDAVVEECFPPGAMTDDHSFFGVTDDNALRANQSALFESCARFIDFDKIDVVPMSEYLLKA